MCFLLYPKDFFSGLLVTRGCETPIYPIPIFLIVQNRKLT